MTIQKANRLQALILLGIERDRFHEQMKLLAQNEVLPMKKNGEPVNWRQISYTIDKVPSVSFLVH